MTCLIYYLSDPLQPDVIRYVGKTTSTLSIRLRGHIQHAKHTIRRTYHSLCWIRSLLNRNTKPLITLIEQIESDDIAIHDEREKYWIAYYKSLRYDLTNTTEGGNSIVISEETKRKISAAKKGIQFSGDHKRHISEAQIGRPGPKKGIERDPDTKAKISASRKGIPAWNKGVPCDDKTAERLRTQTIGFNHSDKTKTFISECSKRAWTDERKKRHSEFMKGNHFRKKAL